MITLPSSTIFIEAHKLGVLETQILTDLNSPATSKRTRVAEFNRFARLVRDLGLIPGAKEAKVWGISYGFNSLGELGLFVHIEHTTRAEVQVPQEQAKPVGLPVTRAGECSNNCVNAAYGNKHCGAICRRLG